MEAVAKVDHPQSWADFYQRIIARRKPVIMTSGAYVARAIENWSFDYLVSRVGNSMVDVEVSSPLAIRSTDLTYEKISIADLTKRLTEPLLDKIYYYAEQNFFMDCPDLAEDVDPLPFIPAALVKATTGFIGSPPAYTAAHLHAFSEAVIIQIVGKKRMWLWDEEDAARLYPRDEASQWNFSEINFRQREPVSLETYPDYEGIGRVYEVVLAPGDMLYIPTFCFHSAWCESRESISITNFFRCNPALFETASAAKTVMRAMKAIGVAQKSDVIDDKKSIARFADWFRSMQPAAVLRAFANLT